MNSKILLERKMRKMKISLLLHATKLLNLFKISIIVMDFEDIIDIID